MHAKHDLPLLGQPSVTASAGHIRPVTTLLSLSYLISQLWGPTVHAEPVAGSVLNTPLPAHHQGRPISKMLGEENVGSLLIELDRDHVPADGQAPVNITIKVMGDDGQLHTASRHLTIEIDGGRLRVPGAQTDENGPGGLDRDRATPGIQIDTEHGVAHVQLLAPVAPKDVKLRVSTDKLIAERFIHFVPELRDMIASGLVEGIISRRSMSANAVQPARFNDSFEREIRRWSRQDSEGKTRVAARTAFFLKGVITGSTLLTAAYDSDKETRSRLLRDVEPEAFYPVYGDSATQGFDAQSSERLYVRIDQEKSYALYGDFTTAADTPPLSPSGLQRQQLGTYNRAATGLKARWHQPWGQIDLFASQDRLKQVVEEYPGNGTSGPFAVRNQGAIENSEIIELLVRDKNQTPIIKQTTRLIRFIDYAFEPFSGRILLKQPIASLTPDGDPQSLRITYEVDQGGDEFWMGGVNWVLNPDGRFSPGGSYVDDNNPLSPYRLGSANLAVRLGEHTTLVAEAARTESTDYQVGQDRFTTPSGRSGEIRHDQAGNAVRVELTHHAEQADAKVYYQRSQTGFNNASSGLMGGQEEAGARTTLKLDNDLKLYGAALRTRHEQLDAERDGIQAGAAWQITPRLTLDLSLQHMRETGNLPTSATITPNTGALGDSPQAQGGFFGLGTQASYIDPLTGVTQTAFAPSGSVANRRPSQPLDATTARLGLGYQATPKLWLGGDVEHGISGDNQHRYGAGARYRLSDQSRLYSRYETQTGLASAYSLNAADKSTSWISGVESHYMPGGTLFSEYRLRDAQSTQLADVRDQQLASGVRHTWQLSPGIHTLAGAEYLRILNGSQQEAAALSTGLDYTASPLWKGSIKLEWRRVFDAHDVPGDQGQQQWLNTVSATRKLNRDWTLLARNYALWTRHQDNADGSARLGNSMQDRAQIGFAWRPVDNNRVNALARYEFKLVRDDSQPTTDGTPAGQHYRAHIISALADYHPSRPWWLTTRLAAKQSTDFRLNNDQRRYRAWLASARLVYDLTENWDIGVMGSMLGSPDDHSRARAVGVELGYLLTQNLWLSAGHNWAGFHERDLSGGDQTAKGSYMRLRFKFDETLFKGNDPTVNVTLDQSPPPAK
ncbi:hypothetical protein HNQ59_002394 [Chitinivorax tropicus]|uniref:Uncharacterized protein n=1 Tax=Chitinivorax tropicus TaxID=714531 RepID=A0A840MRN3_9PROT|nr:hypothetical protein [Chitinivorax tropicus]MBB5019096.1 hypothetical protein [Chitinivorax tropicus]